jgi:hypothetical protein
VRVFHGKFPIIFCQDHPAAGDIETKRKTMALAYRPLGVVKQLLEEIGLEITYAYEDLIFIQHNPFLLQFGEVGEMLFFSANVETSSEEAGQLFAAIQAKASGEGLTLVHRGRYRLMEAEGGNLSLEFLDEVEP